jgi:hypothetical protein
MCKLTRCGQNDGRDLSRQMMTEESPWLVTSMPSNRRDVPVAPILQSSVKCRRWTPKKLQAEAATELKIYRR